MLKLGQKKLLFKGRFTEVWAREFFDKLGRKHVWEYLHRHNVVYVFPITPDGRVILIRNFRVPFGRQVIEIPAGILDVKGELPAEAAKRELLEETGYEAKEIISVRPWPYRQGSSDIVSYGFIAVGATKIKEASGDAMEDIEVMAVPLKELMDFYCKLPQDQFLGDIKDMEQI